MKDIYRGYEIDDKEFKIYFNNELIHTAKSYDGGLAWIDADIRIKSDMPVGLKK